MNEEDYQLIIIYFNVNMKKLWSAWCKTSRELIANKVTRMTESTQARALFASLAVALVAYVTRKLQINSLSRKFMKTRGSYLSS